MKRQKRSDRCEVVTLGVAFNLLDPYQAKLYEYAKRLPNFSGTMKRLIGKEMETGVPTATNMLVPTREYHAVRSTSPSIDEEEVEFDPLNSLL